MALFDWSVQCCPRWSRIHAISPYQSVESALAEKRQLLSFFTNIHNVVSEFHGTSALKRLFSATQVKTFTEDGPALLAFTTAWLNKKEGEEKQYEEQEERKAKNKRKRSSTSQDKPGPIL